MKLCAFLGAAIFLTFTAVSSALVVEQPGEFVLEKNTVLVVSAEEQGGVPALKYQLRHTMEDGTLVSSDSFSSRVNVGDAIVFYWDAAKRVLWSASKRNLSSLPWTAWEKEKHANDHPTTWMPTNWETTAAWRKWTAAQNPCGGIPADFLKEAGTVLGS